MLFSFCACARQNVNSTEPQTSGTTVSTTAAPPAWQRQKDSPQNQGVDPAVLNDVHETFDSFPLLSSVIVRNGYIVDEYYKDGYDENSVFVLNPASKSVTSALIGIAVDMGLIESVDVPISTYFPQVLENGGYWAEITTPVISIKNPYSGKISVPAVGEVILDDENAKAQITVTGSSKTVCA